MSAIFLVLLAVGLAYLLRPACAIDPVNLSAVTPHLKEWWIKDGRDGPARQAFNSETLLLSRLKRKRAQVAGEYYLYDVYKSRNFGTGPRGETSGSPARYLPVAGRLGRAQALLRPADYFGVIKLTGRAISSAKGRNASVISLVKDESDGVMEGLQKHINRDMFGDGTGALAAVTGAATGTYDIPVASTNNLEEGMPIVIAVAATGVCIASNYEQTIVSVDEVNSTINVAADPGTLDSTHAIFPNGVFSNAGTNTSEAYAKACQGLSLIISDTGTFQNINRATAGNGYWKAQVEDGSAGMSIDQMLKLRNKMKKKAGGKLSFIVTSEVQWRIYGMLFNGGKRWEGNIKKLDGFPNPVLEFNEIALTWDVDCPDDRMYFVDESTLDMLIEEDIGWMDFDGNVFRKVGSGSTSEDAWEAVVSYRFQLGCSNPAKNGVYKNLPLVAA